MMGASIGFNPLSGWYAISLEKRGICGGGEYILFHFIGYSALAQPQGTDRRQSLSQEEDYEYALPATRALRQTLVPRGIPQP